MSSRSKKVEKRPNALAIMGCAIGIVLLVTLVIWWWGRPQYPEVSTPDSMHMIRALYTACSSRDEARLAKVEGLVSEAVQEGSLTEEEQAAFDAIIALARAADWEQATDATYQFAQDQVR